MAGQMPGTWTVCVDFGTSTCKAAAAWRRQGEAFVPAHVRLMHLGEGDGDNPLTLKSVVYLDNGRIFFGEAGWRRAQAAHTRANRQALSSFKTLLSSADLEHSIGLLVSPRIDPVGIFRQRDLIVLFLAFLIRRIDRAQGLDAVLAKQPRPMLRYSYPGWTSSDDVARHKLIARLFDEGMIVADMIEEDFGANQGLSYDTARAALKNAADVKVASRIEGVVFEATAAAACRLVGHDAQAAVAAVIDMGAGTTDIGGYSISESGAIEEIAGVQRTLDIAGDTVDRVLMNVIVKKARHVKDPAARGLMWRALLPQIRGLKETLISAGRCTFEHEGKPITVKLGEVTRRGDFKRAMNDIREAYTATLNEISGVCLDSGKHEIAVVLAGGGANYPFLQDLAKRPRPAKGKVRLKVEPLVPEWAQNGSFGDGLAAVFPQLSIAIGGAIAPAIFVRQRHGPTAPSLVGL
jgi:molecular chaperone DnaK (HSP70)